jgi:hypothetical protein
MAHPGTELRRAIEVQAEALGVKVQFYTSSHHQVARLSNGRSTRKVFFSTSPSSSAAVHQVRADVRRTVRQMENAS